MNVTFFVDYVHFFMEGGAGGGVQISFSRKLPTRSFLTMLTLLQSLKYIPYNTSTIFWPKGNCFQMSLPTSVTRLLECFCLYGLLILISRVFLPTKHAWTSGGLSSSRHPPMTEHVTVRIWCDKGARSFTIKCVKQFLCMLFSKKIILSLDGSRCTNP